MNFSKITLCFFLGLLSVSCEVVNNLSSFPSSVKIPLTETEIVQGLREALSIGLNTSVTSASSVDGFLKNEAIKILLPADVIRLESKIKESTLASGAYQVYIKKFNGGRDLFQELVSSMNKGAEKAAAKASPIFLGAMRSMSIQDARGILNGGQTAATDYFYKSTHQKLSDTFSPEVKSALSSTGANSIYEKTYEFLTYDPAGLGLTTVGKLLNVSIAPSLEEYATEKAIEGLFYLVGEEEKKIRANPKSYGRQIIDRVFGGS